MNNQGKLNKELTKFIENTEIDHLGYFIKIDDQIIFSLNMLYNWFITYLIKNNLIKDKYWVYPNSLMDTLFRYEYNKFGIQKGYPYRLQTFLRMIGTLINYDYINLNNIQKEYIINQSDKLSKLRSDYTI